MMWELGQNAFPSLFFFYISTLITVDWVLAIHFVKFPQWSKVLKKVASCSCTFHRWYCSFLEEFKCHCSFITCSSLWTLKWWNTVESWICINNIKFLSGDNRDNFGHAVAEYFDVPVILIIFRYFNWILCCLAFLCCS